MIRMDLKHISQTRKESSHPELSSERMAKFLQLVTHMKRFVLFIFLVVTVLACIHPVSGNESTDFFPTPAGLEDQVSFWVDVFTRYSINHQIIHDADRPERVYRIADLRDLQKLGEVTRDKREAFVESERRKVVSILKKLASGNIDVAHLSGEEARLYRLFGEKPSRKVLLRAFKRVRVQGGMKEAFRDGIVRSGRYIDGIQEILNEHGLPEELAFLPHVESSFNPHARSKYGAAGIWQFTRSTGRYYLKIRREVDERCDPVLSTQAAARLLKTNYRALDSWPLAIMAYNYGLRGIQYTVRKIGTKDVEKIIRTYRSRRFGFASRNFYTEFIAAVRVAQSPETYFGDIELDPPLRFKTVILPAHQPLDSVLAAYEMTAETLKDLNPALRPTVFRKERMIPKGYRLRLPMPESVLAMAESSNTREDEDNTGFISSLTDKLKTWVGILLASSREGRSSQETAEDSSLSESNKTVSMAGVSADDDSRATLDDVTERSPTTFADGATPTASTMPSLEIRGTSLVVLPEETLGHYADWLEVSAQSLRRLNGLRFRQPIYVGQELRLTFHRVQLGTFEEKRLAFHKALLDEFLCKYRIDESRIHTIRSGETLWTVANQRYDVPLWLLMACNGVKDPNRVTPGQAVIVPVVQSIDAGYRRAVEIGN